MSTQGQWSGQWPGDWFGSAEEAPPGSISGVAALSLSATGTITATEDTEGQNNGVQRPLAGLHVVAPPRRKIEEPSPGWLVGVATMRVDAYGELTGVRRRKLPRRQWLEVLELELV